MNPTSLPTSPRRWWVSWYDTRIPFTLHSPWWITGRELGGGRASTICAAVIAVDEDAARQVIIDAHDEAPEWIRWRFVDEQEPDWSPFSDRFPRGDWMQWPDAAVTA